MEITENGEGRAEVAVASELRDRLDEALRAEVAPTHFSLDAIK